MFKKFRHNLNHSFNLSHYMSIESFAEVDVSPIDPSNKKLILFRLPSDCDLSILNGQKINISSLENIIDHQEKKIKFKLNKIDPSTYSTFRPIVLNTLTNEPTIGEKFDACITITKIIEPEVPESIDYTSSGYNKLEQAIDFSIPKLPVGSYSHQIDLKKRLDKKTKRLNKLENGNDSSKSPSQPHKINLIPETPSKTPKKKQKKV